MILLLYMQVELSHRQIYFHIKGKKPEVHLHLLEGEDKTWANKHLSRISGDHLVYYKPDCLRVRCAWLCKLALLTLGACAVELS